MAAICIVSSGMVSAVGFDAPSSCAAIRCAIDNFQETCFLDRARQWLLGATVSLDEPCQGRTKLVRMAARAIGEAMQQLEGVDSTQVPLLLGVPKRTALAG